MQKVQRRLPPVPALGRIGYSPRAGRRDGAACRTHDIWGEMKLLALMHVALASVTPDFTAWDALAAATRGGAAVLGLDADIGTLEPGKWADLCCIDLGGPATQPLNDPVTQLVFCGGRDIVSDVWVAGRQLLSDREMTRLDWAAAAPNAPVPGRFD